MEKTQVIGPKRIGHNIPLAQTKATHHLGPKQLDETMPIGTIGNNSDVNKIVQNMGTSNPNNNKQNTLQAIRESDKNL